MKKKLQKFCFNPAQSTFGTPSTKIYIFFFALIKKFFLQTLVAIILDIIKFLEFWDKQNEEKLNFTHGLLDINIE